MKQKWAKILQNIIKEKVSHVLLPSKAPALSPALMAAEALGVPLIILKKQPSKILNHDLYQTVVTSYTKGTSYELTISAKYISENGQHSYRG